MRYRLLWTLWCLLEREIAWKLIQWEEVLHLVHPCLYFRLECVFFEFKIYFLNIELQGIIKQNFMRGLCITIGLWGITWKGFLFEKRLFIINIIRSVYVVFFNHNRFVIIGLRVVLFLDSYDAPCLFWIDTNFVILCLVIKYFFEEQVFVLLVDIIKSFFLFLLLYLCMSFF